MSRVISGDGHAYVESHSLTSTFGQFRRLSQTTSFLRHHKSSSQLTRCPLCIYYQRTEPRHASFRTLSIDTVSQPRHSRHSRGVRKELLTIGDRDLTVSLLPAIRKSTPQKNDLTSTADSMRLPQNQSLRRAETYNR